MANQSSRCAACNYMGRECTPDCVFAPHFPHDEQEKFVAVHEVFSANNVSQRLKELPVSMHTDYVSTLVTHANAHLEKRRKVEQETKAGAYKVPDLNISTQDEEKKRFRLPYYPLKPDRNSVPHPYERLYRQSDFLLNPPEIFDDHPHNNTLGISSGSDDGDGPPSD